jgi:hypothetical protein
MSDLGNQVCQMGEHHRQVLTACASAAVDSHWEVHNDLASKVKDHHHQTL